MTPYFTKNFKKSYAKRIKPHPNLVKRFEEKYDLFEEDPSEAILFDHALSGRLAEYRAFSITGEIRVVYFIENNIIFFIDIGTHNQVYGKFK